ncbi:MAG TPA: hypothetical protein VLI06_19790 [Solimonas sp.]|nr:hypothetical protein [Solimonas sp.]
MRLLTARAPAFLASSLLAMALVACDGVGEGSSPKSLELSKPSALLGKDKTFTCFRDRLLLKVVFTDGKFSSNFNSRAKWTSSRPDLLFVSNFGDKVPNQTTDLFFQQAGELLPLKSSGGQDVVITADAFGLKATYKLKVIDPTEIKVTASGYGVDNATAISIARESLQPLALSAKLDGYISDVTSGAESWSFDAASDAEREANAKIATFVATAPNTILASDATDGSLVARPKLLACNADNPLLANAKIGVTVAQADSLIVEGEPDFGSAPGEIVVTTSELLSVYAGFGGSAAKAQNLSSQVGVESADATILRPLLAGAVVSPTALTALKAGGPLAVTYSYGTADKNGKVTAAVSRSAVDEPTPVSIEVQPEATTIDALTFLQFHAIGTYASGRTQDISRHLGWSSSDAAKVAIGEKTGRAVSITTARKEDGSADPHQVTITAHTGTSPDVGDSTVLNVEPPNP